MQDASKRPPGALLTRPRDASGRLPRLPGCAAAAPEGRPRGPNGRARAAAIAHPGGQTAASAAVHAAAMEPAAPATLPAATAAEAASRCLHRVHGKGRNNARTAEGRVRTVEMDAGGRPGLEWWWWLRQGPGRPCTGAQDQQQAALEGEHTHLHAGIGVIRGPGVR